MGGPNSGRRPDPVKRLIGFNQPVMQENASIELPNLSGVREEARKDSTTTGGGVGTESDPVFVALSGGLSYVKAEVDPVFVALSGGLDYVATEVDPIFVALSGAYWVENSGAFVTEERVKVDAGATADYIGATNADGVLRTTSPLTYSDGGNWIGLGLDETAICHDNLDNLDYASAGHTGFQPAGSYLTAETDPVFVALSGGLPFLPTTLD